MAFALTGPDSIILNQGESTPAMLKILAASKPYRNVGLTVSGLPNGVTAEFFPSTGKPSFNSTMTLRSADNSVTGTFTIIVTARDARSSQSMPIIFSNYQPPNVPPPVVGPSAPVLSSLSPSSITEDTGAFTLTVNGSGFVSGAVVLWNGSSRTTIFVNSGQVTAAILAGDITTPGTASVTATNPGSSSSNSLTFTINSVGGFTADVWLAKSGDGGSDSNNGLSEGAPKLTLSAALTVLVAQGSGKKLAIKNGTWSESIDENSITLPSGASWAAATQIVPYPGHTVTISGVNLLRVNYLIVGSMTGSLFVAGPANAAFTIGYDTSSVYAHHIRAVNIDVTNTSTNNVMMINQYSHHDEILYCRLHGAVDGAYGCYCNSEDTLFDHCEIDHNGGDGSVSGNSYGLHIFLAGGGGVDRNVVRFCYIHHNSSVGLAFYDGSNCLAYACIAHNNGHYGFDTGYTETNPRFFNCTSEGNLVAGFAAGGGGSGTTGLKIKNCLAYDNGSNGASLSNGTNSSTSFSTNLRKTGETDGLGAFSLTTGTSPFTGGAGAAAYAITNGSAADEAGTSLASEDVSMYDSTWNVNLAVDYAGVTRPNGTNWDIGAYEG